MEALKSNFSAAGIVINLSQAPFNTVVANAHPCSSTSPCNPMWDMEYWGSGWIFAPDYDPTGDEIFSTDAGSNSGGFSDPRMDQLIDQTEVSSSLNAMYAYEDYGARVLPVVWLPVSYAQLSEIKSNLRRRCLRIRCCSSTRRTGT